MTREGATLSPFGDGGRRAGPTSRVRIQDAQHGSPEAPTGRMARNEAAFIPGIDPEAATASFTVMLLNVRSVNNKAAALNDYFIDTDPDVICLTETWITDDTPKAVIRALVQDTFELQHCPRPGLRKGGGVGILSKHSIRLKTPRSTRDRLYTQFEHMECRLQKPPPLIIVVIYRPPPTAGNGGDWNTFIDEVSDLMGRITQGSSSVIFLGDLNIHLENLQSTEASEFLQLLHSLGLEQYITKPTQHPEILSTTEELTKK